MACVLDKDLWLMNADSEEKIRLTYSHTPQTDLLSAAGQVIFEVTNHQELLVIMFQETFQGSKFS